MAILVRVLCALPILLVTPLMIRAFTFADPAVSTHMEKVRATPSFDLNNQTFRLLDSFFGLPVLDDIFAGNTAAFALAHVFPENIGAYWQSLVFMTEYAGIYALFMLEGCRGVNEGRFFSYPFILTFFGQIVTGGLLGPIWLFFYLVLTPQTKYHTPGAIAISPAHAAAILPTIVLAYYIPNFAALLPEDLNTRHWWMWIWQLHPVWGSLSFFLFSRLLASVVSGLPSRKIIQGTIVAISMVNAYINWYTDVNSSFSVYELFVPKFLTEKPEDPIVAMMTILQYDHICTFGGVILWLLCSLFESSSDAKGRTLGVLGVLGFLSVFGVLNAGTVVLIAWELRERIMIADLEAVILKDVDGMKKED